MDKKIKLYAFYTEDVISLLKFFLESIEDDWDLNIIKVDEIDGNSNTGSEQWYKTIYKKVEYIREVISENFGEIIIVSDIDIQFFGKTNDIIIEKIKNNDLLFTKEYDDEPTANGGFIVIKCNENTLRFYDEVLKYDLSTYPLADQTVFNLILNEEKVDITWDFLPFKKFYLSPHKSIPRGLLFHHAMITEGVSKENFKFHDNEGNDIIDFLNIEEVTSLQQKQNQLRKVRDFFSKSGYCKQISKEIGGF